jgi:hypothetical protein
VLGGGDGMNLVEFVDEEAGFKDGFSFEKLFDIDQQLMLEYLQRKEENDKINYNSALRVFQRQKRGY